MAKKKITPPDKKKPTTPKKKKKTNPRIDPDHPPSRPNNPKNPYSGRSKKFTDEELILAIQRYHGLIYVAAKKLGCSPRLFYNRLELCPELKEAIEEERELFVDEAEKTLRDCVNDRESWAVCLVLKTLGKKRGYVEEKIHRHGGDREAPPIQTTSTFKFEDLNLPVETQAQVLEAIRKKKSQATANLVNEEENSDGKELRDSPEEVRESDK